ncbi:MAG: RNA polymerase subunit sigma, partial [Candidatus Rokuibacteriota bacterium]
MFSQSASCHRVAPLLPDVIEQMATGIELIRGMAAGNRDAFSGFYDRYAPLVYPLVLRVVRDPADAADVLQETFWEAWRSAGTYDDARGTPEAWIIMRARARAIDRVRAVRRRSETFVAPVDEAVMAAAPGADPVERSEQRQVIKASLGQLTAVQREVIELAYYSGLTQTEIA